MLISPRQYGLHPAEASARIRPLLELSGLRISNRHLHLRALDILSTYPHLGFEDALTAAIVEEQEISLLSYDADFDAVSGVQREEPGTT